VSKGKERANWAVGLVDLPAIVVSRVDRKMVARFRRFMAGMPTGIEIVTVGRARRMMKPEKAMQTFTADHRCGEQAQNAPRYSGSKASHLQNHR
jgi:hypothetical protein